METERKLFKGAQQVPIVCEVCGKPAVHLIVPSQRSGAPYGTILCYCARHTPYPEAVADQVKA